MKAHREQLALDQVGLRGLAQANSDIGRAHGEIELLVGRDQGQVDIRIELDELTEARGEPMHADPRGCRDAQVAVWPLAAVGEFRARSSRLGRYDTSAFCCPASLRLRWARRHAIGCANLATPKGATFSSKLDGRTERWSGLMSWPLN